MGAPGSHADLDELLGHADWLRRLARSLVSAGSADDLVQDTLLVAMKSPPDPDRPPRPWLAQVLRNLVRMQHRSDGRRARRDEVAALAPAAAPRPDDHVDRLRTQRALCEHVLALGEPYRRTLVLHYYDGLSLADIARQDGIPVATVRWRHAHALELLRAELDDGVAGDRRQWMAALVPVAGPAASSAAVGTLLGGVVMKKVVAVIVILAIGLFAAWRLTRGGAGASATAPTPPAAPSAPGVHLSFAASGEPPTTGESSVHGRVLPTGTTARVTLLAMAGLDERPRVVSSRDGDTYHFEELAPGSYCVVAQAGDRHGSACGIRVGRADRVDQDVEVGADGVRLHGTVRDADAGPVPQPVVIAQRQPELGRAWVSHGGADGSFALRLPAGRYRVTVTGDGYTSAVRHVELDADQLLDVLLNPSAEIAGLVLDGRTGEPAAGAAVLLVDDELARRTVTTDARGRFAISDLRTGRYSLAASLGELVAQVHDVGLALGGSQDVTLTLLDRGAALSGRVVEAGTGQPIAGARVEVSGALTRSVVSDAAGTFTIRGLLAGDYAVQCLADGFVLGATRAVLSEQGRSGMVVELVRGATVTGVVRLSSGEPVAGAVIESSAWALQDPRLADVRSRADGAFTLAPVPAGRARLVAFHPAHGVSELVVVEVAAGAGSTTALVFDAASSISGVVRHDDGSVAAGAQIAIVPREASAQWTTVADGDGRFRVASLPAGDYTVRASPASSLPAQTLMHKASHVDVTLAAGKGQKVELEVPATRHRIRGRVIDAGGAPVAGAAVWAERQLEGQIMSGPRLDDLRVFTWSDGSFELADLPDGSFAVHAWHVDHATGKRAPVVAGAADVTVALPAAASFAGQVVRADGTAVTAFRLEYEWVTHQDPNGGSASRLSARVFTDANGHFTVPALEPSVRYDLQIEATDGSFGAVEPFALAAGERKTGLRVVVAAVGTVRGRLIDKRTGAPALGLQVLNLSHQGSIAVDGNGRFEAAVPAGSYDALYTQSLYAGNPGVAISLEVRPGEVADLGDVVIDVQ